jgi:transposase
VRERFGRTCCRETIHAALRRSGLSWKTAKTLLGRADPARRQAFVEQLRHVLADARHDRHLLVYLDEAHIHQDADLGYGWAERGRRLWVASGSPGLSAKVSFYGLYLYDEGQVRLWPYPRANGEHTIEVLRRLRAEHPDRELVVLWDGASYHRAGTVREAAAALRIELRPLPGYSPDLMPVEALWRWLREDVTYHHCHASRDDLTRRVAASRPASTESPAPPAYSSLRHRFRNGPSWVKPPSEHLAAGCRLPSGVGPKVAPPCGQRGAGEPIWGTRSRHVARPHR